MRFNRWVIAVGALVLIGGAFGIWREFVVGERVRAKFCSLETATCLQDCEAARSEATSRILFDEIREVALHSERLLDCISIDAQAAAVCREAERVRHAAAEQELVRRQRAVDAAFVRCRAACCDEATRRGCPGTAAQCPAGPFDEQKPDRSFEVDCLDAPGAPCFQELPEICTEISGVCGDCLHTLCGDRTWTFEADSLLEASLITAKRTLASSTVKGNRATLVIPSSLTLEAGETLRMSFTFSGASKKTRKVSLFRATR